MLFLARIVRLATSLVVGLIVVGIALFVLEANRDNWLAGGILDAARWLVDPFAGIFSLDDRKWEVVVNWGIAAAVYGFVGMLISRLLARASLARLRSRRASYS